MPPARHHTHHENRQPDRRGCERRDQHHRSQYVGRTNSSIGYLMECRIRSRELPHASSSVQFERPTDSTPKPQSLPAARRPSNRAARDFRMEASLLETLRAPAATPRPIANSSAHVSRWALDLFVPDFTGRERTARQHHEYLIAIHRIPSDELSAAQHSPGR